MSCNHWQNSFLRNFQKKKKKLFWGCFQFSYELLVGKSVQGGIIIMMGLLKIKILFKIRFNSSNILLHGNLGLSLNDGF